MRSSRRRSPRFVCHLLKLDYDEMHLGIFIHFSVDELLVIAQTCKLLCIFILRAVFTNCLKDVKVLKLYLHRTIECDFVALATESNFHSIVQLKTDLQNSAKLVQDIELLFKKIVRRHNLYYNYPHLQSLIKSIFKDVCGLREMYLTLMNLFETSHKAIHNVETWQRKCSAQA